MMKTPDHGLLTNITDIDVNDFGITADGMKDFIKIYLNNLNKSIIDKGVAYEDSFVVAQQPDDVDHCGNGYCQGEMRDFFLDYKNIHGYIALVVSFNCFY